MSFMDKAHLVILWTVDSGDEGEWDRIFASHGEWMTGHTEHGGLCGYEKQRYREWPTA